MNKYQRLQNIADVANTVTKVKEIYNQSSVLYKDTAYTITSDHLSVIGEVLKTLSTLSPQNTRGKVTKIIDQTTQWSSTYKDLKTQVKSAQGKNLNIETILKILETLKPVLDSKNALHVDKMLQIHHILKA